MLILNELCFDYDSSLLEQISLQLKAGDYALLTGANGCGKTTLLQILVGYRQAKSGAAYLNQKNLFGLPAQERAKLIAYVPQSFKISTPITVENFLSLALYPFKKEERLVLTNELNPLIEQTRSTSLLKTKINELSLGQQRKIALLAALASKPQLLLLDETYSFLDLEHSALFENILADYQRKSGAIIIEVSHQREIHDAEQKQVYHMNAGKLFRLELKPHNNQQTDFYAN